VITFGSLFAGIGGIDLGFERAGMECKWQVEIDDYATKVLEKHWPGVHRERDIRQCGKHNLERVDIIAGGFPCQDISYAGRGAGLDGERSGLFFEAVRLVCELQPRVVVLENVAALLTRGLDRVLGTLAEIGFDAEWHCIPAAAVGAPHIRDRVFVIGTRSSNAECKRARNEGGKISDKRRKHARTYKSAIVRQGHRPIVPKGIDAVCADVAYTNSKGLERCNRTVVEPCNTARCCADVADSLCGGWKGSDEQRCSIKGNRTDWVMQPTGGGSSVSGWWAAEPSVGRVANGIPKRVDRLRGLGNAVVPQVAELIGRQIVLTLADDNQRALDNIKKCRDQPCKT
jgi:DNA (cytosine-5)-methyltransferase 1